MVYKVLPSRSWLGFMACCYQGWGLVSDLSLGRQWMHSATCMPDSLLPAAAGCCRWRSYNWFRYNVHFGPGLAQDSCPFGESCATSWLRPWEFSRRIMYELQDAIHFILNHWNYCRRTANREEREERLRTFASLNRRNRRSIWSHFDVTEPDEKNIYCVF